MQIIDCIIVSIEKHQMIYLKMSQHLDLNMIENTIHWTLNEYEYHHHLAIAKLFLTKNNMRNWLVFAQKYADYDTLNWACVIFIDELTVQNEDINHKFMIRQFNEQYHKHCFQPKFRKSFYCIIWETICKQFKSSLIIWD